MNIRINCQAFLEKRKILSIVQLKADIHDYEMEQKQIIGNIAIEGDCYLDNLDEMVSIKELVPFNVMLAEQSKVTLQDIMALEIQDFVYHIVDGRGLELEFDIVVQTLESGSVSSNKNDQLNLVEQTEQEIDINEEDGKIEEIKKIEIMNSDERENLNNSKVEDDEKNIREKENINNDDNIDLIIKELTDISDEITKSNDDDIKEEALETREKFDNLETEILKDATQFEQSKEKEVKSDIKEEIVNQIDVLLSNKLSMKSDNFPDDKFPMRGLSDQRKKVTFVFYNDDNELNEIVRKYNLSIGKALESSENNGTRGKKIIIHG